MHILRWTFTLHRNDPFDFDRRLHDRLDNDIVCRRHNLAPQGVTHDTLLRGSPVDRKSVQVCPVSVSLAPHPLLQGMHHCKLKEYCIESVYPKLYPTRPYANQILLSCREFQPERHSGTHQVLGNAGYQMDNILHQGVDLSLQTTQKHHFCHHHITLITPLKTPQGS
jgi:hypothetical protein